MGRYRYLEGHDCAPDVAKDVGVEADVAFKHIQMSLMQDPALDGTAKVVQRGLHAETSCKPAL